MRGKTLIFLVCMLPLPLFGQVVIDRAMEDDLERLSERSTSEDAVSEALDDLVSRSLHPIDLNNATEAEMASIPGLSEQQAGNLYLYCKSYGEVFTIFELRAVPGFDSLLIERIRPYIRLRGISAPPPTPGNLLRRGSHNLLLRYEQLFPTASGYKLPDSAGQGFTQGGYAGTPARYLLRYSYNWQNKLRVGFSGEKDPGEQFFAGAQQMGMDFYSGYIALTNAGIIKHLILGSYRASFGQGLVVGSGMITGSLPGFSSMHSDASSPLRPAGGIRPTLSLNESDYLRGLAVGLKAGLVEVNALISYHPRDGNVTRFDSATETILEVSSLGGSGYHRTDAELEDKASLRELLTGGNINLTFRSGIRFGMKIGITGLYSKWSATINPEMNPGTLYAFRGSSNTVIGGDLILRYSTTQIALEMARSSSGGVGIVAMASTIPVPGVNLLLLIRSYGKDFHNMKGNAFCQGGSNRNEQGIYVATSLQITPRVTLSLFADLYRFPWLRYQTDFPSQGYEAGVLTTVRVTSELDLTMRYNLGQTQVNGPTGDKPLRKPETTRLHSLRFSIDWRPLPALQLKTSLEAKSQSSVTGESGVFGYLVCQDLQLNASRTISGVLRYALFDIPGYEQRIYKYEPEVLYGYSMPAYSGKGTRTCLVLKYRAARFLDLWLRGAATIYYDRNMTGSGLEQRNGFVVAEITGQAVIHW